MVHIGFSYQCYQDKGNESMFYKTGHQMYDGVFKSTKINKISLDCGLFCGRHYLIYTIWIVRYLSKGIKNIWNLEVNLSELSDVFLITCFWSHVFDHMCEHVMK